MAYTACAANLGANIAPDCAAVQKSEYVGEGVMIDLVAVNPSVTADSSNPRVLTNIVVESGDKVAVVDNLIRDPFSGASRTMNVESGVPTFDISIPIRVPNISAAVAKEVIEPLAKSHFLLILPTTDKKFFVFGMYGKLQASEVSHTLADNGGAALATMTSNEPYFCCELKSTDYAATKAIYDALKAHSF